MKKYKIIVSPSAKAQIRNIAAHIKEKLSAPQAAKATALDIKNAIASLSGMPERIPLSRDKSLRVHDMHCMVVQNYLVYFQIDEAKKQVNVAAVIYGRRDQAAQAENILPR